MADPYLSELFQKIATKRKKFNNLDSIASNDARLERLQLEIRLLERLVTIRIVINYLAPPLVLASVAAIIFSQPDNYINRGFKMIFMIIALVIVFTSSFILQSFLTKKAFRKRLRRRD